jgi:transcriptional regulator with XRE-family HTH domain
MNTSRPDRQCQIGRRLRDVRASRNISQAELGRLAGLAARDISLYERGAGRLCVCRLSRIATALDVDLGWLLAPVPLDEDRHDEVVLALLSELDLVALRKLSALRDPATKREIVGLLSALIDSEGAAFRPR